MNKKTKLMLQAILDHSDNEACKAIAKRILNNESTIEEELKYTGSFMTAVLSGDSEFALAKADIGNKKALQMIDPSLLK